MRENIVELLVDVGDFLWREAMEGENATARELARRRTKNYRSSKGEDENGIRKDLH